MSRTALIDAIGVSHAPAVGPARIVSLVPSLTELLFDLELADQVVGRTRYCIHPAERVAGVPSVGGTKKIQHRQLEALRPTHVIVNIDENTQPMVARIADYAPHIVVTHPLRPEDNPALYRLLGGLFHRRERAETLCGRFEEALAAIRRQDWPRRRVLYLIWRKPWMGIARDTYISRALALVGWDTLPALTAQRYPTLELNSQLLAEADRVLFSSEPYPFTPAHLAEFARRYHCAPEKLALIDAEMTSWYGSRAIVGLEYLRRFALARA